MLAEHADPAQDVVVGRAGGCPHPRSPASRRARPRPARWPRPSRRSRTGTASCVVRATPSRSAIPATALRWASTVRASAISVSAVSNCQLRSASRIARGSCQPSASASVRPYDARACARASSSAASSGRTTHSRQSGTRSWPERGLEQVEQRAPVRGAPDALRGRDTRGRPRRRHRRPAAAGRRPSRRRRRTRPSPATSVAHPVGERRRERQRRRVPVRVGGGRRPLAVARGPRVEREGCGPGLVRHLRAVGGLAELRGGAQRVERGEALVRPAVRQQVTVEPAVRGLVDHRAGIRPVRDVHAVLGRVVDTRPTRPPPARRSRGPPAAPLPATAARCPRAGPGAHP